MPDTPRISILQQPSPDGRLLLWLEGPVAIREDGAAGFNIRVLPVREMRDWARIWFKEEEVRT